MHAEKQLLKPGGPLHHWLTSSPTARRAQHWDWHKGAVNPKNQPPTNEELDYLCEYYGYAQTGPQRPSHLYLQMLSDTVLPLTKKPMHGVVSPQLLATTGTIPITIFSTGPHIIQHYYDCIVEAQSEVLLLTNYWQGGKNVDKIAAAFRELNRRSAERGATVVVKIMWDRGPRKLADLFRKRKSVNGREWEDNGLPLPTEVPQLKIEILNYHRPLMGTFHAKLLLIDRRIALLNSINIQDRPNLESCVHLEGDIVNAVYDHAVISWGNAFQVPLPCINSPAPDSPATNFENRNTPETQEAVSKHARRELAENDTAGTDHRLNLSDIVGHMMFARAGATDADPIQHSTNDLDARVRHMATLWRSKAQQGRESGRRFLSDSASLFRGQSWRPREMRDLGSEAPQSLDPDEAARRLNDISESLNFANNSAVKGSLDPDVIEKSHGGWDAQRAMGLLDFEPVIYHEPHAPVPMALVNRRPHGRPGHDDIDNPQNSAWLAGFRYAKQHVFIQSPTLNATPVKHAILACVRRGVKVELWLDLGFNDKSESMPFQGGTNEQVVSGLYETLRNEGKGDEKLLEVYWYTGKDMDRPLNAIRKQRNCHVCLAPADPGKIRCVRRTGGDLRQWKPGYSKLVPFSGDQCNAGWPSHCQRVDVGFASKSEHPHLWQGGSSHWYLAWTKRPASV